jgi:hypothetical protein
VRIDHVVVAVADLDVVADTCVAAGFVVTPQADHPFGTSNRLVVLEGSYLELVSVTEPGRLPIEGFAARVAAFLSTGAEGITHLVASSTDPDRDEAELGALVTRRFSFSRPAPRVDGTVLTATFTCLLTDDDPDLGVFWCHHHTPEAVWNPPALAHANGARRLLGVKLPVRPATLSRLARLAGLPATAPPELDGVTIEAGPATIRVDGSVAVTAGGVLLTGA